MSSNLFILHHVSVAVAEDKMSSLQALLIGGLWGYISNYLFTIVVREEPHPLWLSSGYYTARP